MYLFRFLNTPLGGRGVRQHRRLPRAANTLAPPLFTMPSCRPSERQRSYCSYFMQSSSSSSSSSSASSKFIVRLLQNGHRCITDTRSPQGLKPTDSYMYQSTSISVSIPKHCRYVLTSVPVYTTVVAIFA